MVSSKRNKSTCRARSHWIAVTGMTMAVLSAIGLHSTSLMALEVDSAVPDDCHIPAQRIQNDTFITGLTLSPDGNTFAFGRWDGLIRIWHMKAGKEVDMHIGHFGTTKGSAGGTPATK
jgi:WD40 repeat protein